MKISTQVKLAHMKQSNNPIVLSKRLFCVVANETKTKGYWKNEKGKVFVDNIELKSFFAIEEDVFNIAKKLLFSKGEEAVFYKDCNNNAIIENKEGKKTKFSKRIAWIEGSNPSKEYIEVLLQQHNGLTIYQLEEEVFLIEIYK